MLKVDLHLHTRHSFDCDYKVETIVRAAEAAGLDAVAITDHDTMSGCAVARKAARKMTIIPGMEISTWKGTHLIGLFLKEEIQSRDILDVIDEIHDQGGLVLLPHPFRRSTGLMYGRDKHGLYDGDEIREILNRLDLVELANHRSEIKEITDTDAFFSTYPELPLVGGSDAHEPENVGKAHTVLEISGDNAPETIRRALLKAPRIIRFEAYASTSGTDETVRMPLSRTRGWLGSTQQVLPTIRKSFRSLYNRSTRVIFNWRKKGIRKEKSQITDVNVR